MTVVPLRPFPASNASADVEALETPPLAVPAPTTVGKIAWVAVAGIAVAAMVDTLNASLMTVGRGHIMGTTLATPDGVAWVNMAFLMAKLVGFPVGAWAAVRFGARHSLLFSLAVLGAATLLGALPTTLDGLVLARIAQGFAGGIVLVVAQTALFWIFPSERQGMVQACYALSVVMGTATLAPGVHGLFVDGPGWQWVLVFAASLAILAFVLLFSARRALPSGREARSFDWIGVGAFTVAMVALTFVLIEGDRYAWFENHEIVAGSVVGLLALAVFIARLLSARRSALVDTDLFANDHFVFGFIVSFVAGFALFGSGFVIPAFAQQALGFTPLYAGLLLIPSAVTVGVGILVAGALLQFKRLNPLALYPFGILSIIGAMWLLSRSTPDSGFVDLTLPLVLRGAGLGFLFMGLTFETLISLRGPLTAYGVGLFNVGRQFGGLVGLAYITTYLSGERAIARADLAHALSPGDPDYLSAVEGAASELVSRGWSPAEALAAVQGMIGQEAQQQIATLAFNDAFLVFAFLFPAAAPFLIAVGILQSKLRKGGAH